MGIDTETGRVFMRHAGRTVRHLEKHQGIAMEFWYLDTESGNEFDVRGLPQEYLGAERDKVLNGDRAAHRTVIQRAIDGGHHFRQRHNAA